MKEYEAPVVEIEEFDIGPIMTSTAPTGPTTPLIPL